jgi:hypothetical protein
VRQAQVNAFFVDQLSTCLVHSVTRNLSKKWGFLFTPM